MAKSRSRKRKARSPSQSSESDDSSIAATHFSRAKPRKRQLLAHTSDNVNAEGTVSSSDSETSEPDNDRTRRTHRARTKVAKHLKKQREGSHRRESNEEGKSIGRESLKPYKQASKLVKSLKKSMEEFLSGPLDQLAAHWTAQLRWLDGALQGYDNAAYLRQLEVWHGLEQAAGPILWAQWEKAHSKIGSIMVEPFHFITEHTKISQMEVDREQVKIQAQQDAQQMLIHDFEANLLSDSKQDREAKAIREEMTACKNRVRQQVTKYVDRETVDKEIQMALGKVLQQLY